MAMLQSSVSSSSSFSYGFTYDVFLSFRGSDTRYRFTGNLNRALCDKGIRTFMDDRELQGGEEITSSLFKAIEESRIFIPVLSINYASSSFCLDELVHIINCFKESGRLVLPIFYDVEPSHVRHHTGSYGKALDDHIKKFQNNKDSMERLQKWKSALTQTANFSGHHFNPGNGYEHEFIEKIVKYVSNKINHVPLYVADFPVGIESRVLKVNSLMDFGSNGEVQMLGIYGPGGMGKTTLARAVYNSLADQFDDLCFLHDVRGNSAKYGLEHLQGKLLSKLVKLDIKLGDVYEGIPIIEKRLHQKKVLLILDDVHELKQLEVLAGGFRWFGPGSIVIITTRDKQLLAHHGIERAYKLHKLNEKEALELLTWKALKNNKVDTNFDSVLHHAVTYASGLPLALEVVGSNLFGKNIGEWKSALNQYERIPDKKIQEILKVSFDALGEAEQNVFLDIACCFKGYELKELEDVLHAHYGNCMKYQIRVLLDKSLLNIKQCQWSLTDVVTLHALIEKMGKEIVRKESPKEPGRRSRLWFHKDIIDVLEANKGSSEIEIIYLECSSSEKVVVDWKGDELEKMQKLKTLIVKNGTFSNGPKYLPNSLRVLEWQKYPSRVIPSDFFPKKLSICKLQQSDFTSFELRGTMKRFVNMRELNLDNCQFLTRIHDVSNLSNLEIFSFQQCKNLIEIHKSVGFLNKLEVLNAEGCSKLMSFPPLKLTSLDELRLSDCKNLNNFPEILGEMNNIKRICWENTSIKEVPVSFQNLTKLLYLTIKGKGMVRLPSSIFRMPNLSDITAEGCIFPKLDDKLSSMLTTSPNRLWCITLKSCNLSDEFLPIFVMWSAYVRILDLSGNNFTILPECIKDCHLLSDLILDDCKCLREIRGIPLNLTNLSAANCKSLTSSCRNMLLNQELHEAGGTIFCFSGFVRIPEWFDHQNMGHTISFWFRNKLPSMALCFSTKSVAKGFHMSTKRPILVIDGNNYSLSSFHGYDIMLTHHTYLYATELKSRPVNNLNKIILKNEWNHAEVIFEHSNVEPLTEIGIHFFKHENNMDDIQFTNP
ncbi:TMV resistance protein N [Medicago truncatula]|uniref:TMV resistance protein N n=1 Tax=Medicago truncatula TaxID=3880 RepID=UPI001967C3EA|nr:TMV resistance protein N-like [Medicago truncatula]